MSLREFISDNDLQEAIDQTNIQPHIMMIHYSIRHQLTKRFPASTLRVFGYPSDDPIIWLIHRHNVHVADHAMIMSNPVATVTKQIFDEAFKQFNEICIIKPDDMVNVQDNLTPWFTSYLRTNEGLESEIFPTHLYYMREQQQDLISGMDLKLAEGYRFDEVDISKDASIINSTWIHAGEGDLEQTTEKLRCMPSAVVRCGSDAVSFEMSDPAGFQNHLFTLEPHRNKGLGTAVEFQLCKKYIQDGMWPFKCVELYNKGVLEKTNRSPYWTRYETESKVPIENNFIRILPQNSDNSKT